MDETRTLIASFYSVTPFMYGAIAYPSQHIILIVHNLDEAARRSVREVQKFFGKVATKVDVIEIADEDVYEIAKKVVEVIDRESRPGARIVVNISGGWRALANGMLYACYSRPEKIDRIISNMKDNKGVIELPKLRYSLGATRFDVLKKVAARGDRSIAEMAKELRKTRGMLYQHLKELKEGGYVDEDFKITDAGRLALL